MITWTPLVLLVLICTPRHRVIGQVPVTQFRLCTEEQLCGNLVPGCADKHECIDINWYKCTHVWWMNSRLTWCRICAGVALLLQLNAQFVNAFSKATLWFMHSLDQYAPKVTHNPLPLANHTLYCSFFDFVMSASLRPSLRYIFHCLIRLIK